MLRTIGLIASWFIICCLLEALHGLATGLGLLPYPGKGVIGPIDWLLIVISVPLAIALNRAFRRRRSRPTMTDAQPPSARSLIKARSPPWHKVAPIVIDAIFEALDATELFDCFVLSSMENNLVSRYEQLGHEDRNVSIIRAQISGILCQAGFQKLAALEKEVNNKRIDSATKIGFAATNIFEPAIAMSKDQIGGYIGMAAIYELLGVKAKCHEFAKRGLLELQKIKQSAAGQAMRHSTVFPPDMLDQEERQLRGYLE